MGFYRAIARSLGVSINLSFKAQQLRHRVRVCQKQESAATKVTSA
jgi:hypothetical protein